MSFPTAPSRCLVPLSILRKEIFLDLDVCNATGAPLHLADSNLDSRAAQLCMMALLQQLGVASTVTPAMIEKLFRIASVMPGSEIVEVGTDYFIESVVSVDPQVDRFSKAEAQAWLDLFDHDEFVQMVALFATHYMPIVSLPADEPVQIVKLRFIDPAVLPVGESRTGLSSTGYMVAAPGLALTPRDHIRIIAPEGTQIAGAALLSNEVTATSASSLVPRLHRDEFFLRISPDRAVIYAAGLRRKGTAVVFSLWPSSEGFFNPAILTSLVGIVLLGLGAIGEYLNDVLTKKLEGNLDAAVALLLVAPSLYSVYLSRPGEHELRSRMLTWPRYAVLGTAAAHGFAAVALIAQETLKHWPVLIVWALGCIYCAGVLVYIATIAFRANRSVRRIRARSAHTAGPLRVLRITD